MVEDNQQLKCGDCDMISTLSSLELDMIDEVIKNKVIPTVNREQNFLTENKFGRLKKISQTEPESLDQTIDKKMRS